MNITCIGTKITNNKHRTYDHAVWCYMYMILSHLRQESSAIIGWNDVVNRSVLCQ